MPGQDKVSPLDLMETIQSLTHDEKVWLSLWLSMLINDELKAMYNIDDNKPKRDDDPMPND